MLLERLVLDEGHVGGEHHQGSGGLIGELGRAVPLSGLPLLIDQQTEELVGEDSRAEVPGTIETGAVRMGTTEGVGADQSHNLLVVESHAVEDVTDVLVVLGGVGQTAVRGAGSDVLVLAAGSPGDGRATQLLDGAGTSQSPEIGVGDPRELGLDRLQEVSGSLETSVGAVVGLRGESHGGTVATSGTSLLVIGATCVPCQTDEDLWKITSVPIAYAT